MTLQQCTAGGIFRETRPHRGPALKTHQVSWLAWSCMFPENCIHVPWEGHFWGNLAYHPLASRLVSFIPAVRSASQASYPRLARRVRQSGDQKNPLWCHPQKMGGCFKHVDDNQQQQRWWRWWWCWGRDGSWLIVWMYRYCQSNCPFLSQPLVSCPSVCPKAQTAFVLNVTHNCPLLPPR